MQTKVTIVNENSSNEYQAGRLYIDEDNIVVLCTKTTSGKGLYFSGVILYSDNDNNNLVGEHDNNWPKHLFKEFKGSLKFEQHV